MAVDYSKYKSPITIDSIDRQMEFERTQEEMWNNLKKETDRYCFACIQESVSIEVDEKELIKALEYDREQFEVGYRAGFEAASEILLKKLEEAIKTLILFKGNGKDEIHTI